MNNSVVGTSGASIVSNGYSLYLFASNSRDTVTWLSVLKMRYLAMESNGVMIRNFIPCKRNSDGAIGMYDLVTNVFFGNSGTGIFTAGAEIPQNIDGFLIDKIKSYGTWTVTATDGMKTATQDVLVDAADTFGVEITYRFYLYNSGDPCTDVTGGWKAVRDAGVNNPTLSLNSDHMSIGFLSNSDGRVLTNNVIDITGYTQLGIEYEYTLPSKGGGVFTAADICGGYTGNTQADKSCWIFHYAVGEAGTKPPVVYKPSPAKCPLVQNSQYIMHFANNGTPVKIFKVWLE